MRRTSAIILASVVLLFSLQTRSAFGQGRGGMQRSGGLQRRQPGAMVGQQDMSLGITAGEVEPGSGPAGVRVTGLTPGGMGETAGIKVGDIITEMGETAVSSVGQFSQLCNRYVMLMSRARAAMSLSIRVVVVRQGRSLALAMVPPGVRMKPWTGLNAVNAPNGWGVGGVLVNSIMPDSPADEAGFIPGDVITGIDGRWVASVDDLDNGIISAGLDRSSRVTVRRGERDVVLSLRAAAARPSARADASVRRRLSSINVLKYAVIDPVTRTVTLVGKYDPKYATAGIPYYELLNDAIRSPYPSFSLDPTPETQKSARRIGDAIGDDCRRMFSDGAYTQQFANKLLNLLLNNPELRADGENFIRKGAVAFGIEPDEMRKILAKSSGDASIPEDALIPIVGKVLENMGYKEVGAAMRYSGDDSQAAFAYLGIAGPANEIVGKFRSGQLSREDAGLQVGTLMTGTMLRLLKAPESDVSSMEQKVLSGRMSLDGMTKYMEDHAMKLIVDSVGLKMFNGLTLSDRVLAQLYNVQTPKMKLVFKDLPADSLLGDIMFKADYSLKSVCVSPQNRERLPGFQTEMDYFYTESAARGTRIPGDAGAQIGHRLVPGKVRMRVSPEGNVVAFDDAEIRIIGWVISSEGKKGGGAAAALIKDLVGGYADYLTAHYEDLATVYPELHRLREAAKLIALARWARANNYTLTADKAFGARVAQQTEAGGFWQAVFTADPKEFSLNVVSEGGASFSKEEGEAWVEPSVNRTVTADISKQLVMSTVLANQAAGAAAGGDLEAARDLADKSARAMTGDIDLTKLPSLGELPVVGEPAGAITLSEEALDAVDRNLRQVEEAKITMAKAADIENTKPEEAAKLRADAEAQAQAAQANLKGLHDALDWARNNYGQPAVAVEKVRAAVSAAPQTATAVPSAAPAQPVQPTPTVQVPSPAPAETVEAKPDALTPEERARALKELAELEKELDSTRAQFLKLNKSIQQDQSQFAAWEKVASEGMDKCTGFLYNLLMDASAGQLADRYDTLDKLARKLPDRPADLITRYNHIKNWFKAMSYTQAAKDVADIAARDGKTLQELLEEVRDDLNIIGSITGLDKTVPGAVWKYGSSIADIAYSYAQFSAAYDNIGQLDKNSDNYLKAVALLTTRMQKLVARVKEIKAELGPALDEAQPAHAGRG